MIQKWFPQKDFPYLYVFIYFSETNSTDFLLFFSFDVKIVFFMQTLNELKIFFASTSAFIGEYIQRKGTFEE